MPNININDSITTKSYDDTSKDIIDEDKVITGVTKIWNNPSPWGANERGNFLHHTIPYDQRDRKRIDSTDQPTPWAPRFFVNICRQVPCTQVPAVHYGDHNKLVDDVQLVGRKVEGTTGINTGQSSLTPVTSGIRVTASQLQSVKDVVTNILNILNGYNGWYDANDVCQRTCQVKCQVYCQVGCQSCNTMQCHNQNCGTS